MIAVLFILLCMTAGYFCNDLISVSNQVKKLNSKNDGRLIEVLMRERESIKKELDKKYRDDMSSFEPLVKELEVEKKKLIDLKNKEKIKI